MENFAYHNPTRLYFGRQAIDELSDELEKYGQTILLVTGGGSVKRMGLYDTVMKLLRRGGKTVIELPGISSNPKYTHVLEGQRLCREHHVDLILAVGGGSCIDAAKGIAAAAMMDGDVWEYFLSRASVERALPVATILTIPATGSEMNGNAVISRWDTKEKVAVYGNALYPAFSILDPVYSFSVPASHTVYGAIDIIIHALEHYFVPPTETPLLDYLTEGLVRTAVDSVRRVLRDPCDYDARANLMFAATVANGPGIGLGKQADWASHRIEHELSALYDVPHGAGLAVVYPNWMAYAAEKDPSRFAHFARAVWDVPAELEDDMAAAKAGIAQMRAFFTEIGAPATLEQLGVPADQIPHMARQAVRFGALGSYCKLDAAAVEQILNMCR